MGHEKTARVVALQAEVERIKDRLFEERGRYKVAYMAWRLSAKADEERDYGWVIYDRIQRLKVDLRKAYDLLAEAKQDLEEP